eukprot:868889-Amphidinium_carterae.3
MAKVNTPTFAENDLGRYWHCSLADNRSVGPRLTENQEETTTGNATDATVMEAPVITGTM